jgi:hypothetical protein
MRNIENLAVWVAIIYGIFILIAVAPMYLFSSQQPQSPFLKIAGGAFCLTLLPAALVGMRWKKLSGAWLMVISIAAACSLCLSEVARYRPTDSSRLFLVFSLLWWIVVSTVPGICGFILFTAKSRAPQMSR